MHTVQRLCTRCRKRPAAYLRASSGEALCRQCFIKSIEDKVLRTIRDYELVRSGDNIGLAVSGGKDSLVLLHIISKFIRKKILRDVKVQVFTIDEELEYSKHKLERQSVIRKMCEEAGLSYNVYKISELLGISVEEVYNRIRQQGENIHMCTICGVLRRKAMNELAKRLNLTKIMTAHNLDDEAQTVLLNVFSNDLKRFKWFGVETGEDVESFVPRVKPMRFIREEEIALYAYFTGIPMLERECPYVRENPRYFLKFLLAELERKNPNIKYMIVSFGDSLSRLLQETEYFRRKVSLRRCRICGSPTTSEICRACDLVMKAGLLDKYVLANTSGER